MILIWVGLGGALGSCLRYLTTELCTLFLGKYFPYGTLAVNLIGCALIGLAVGAIENGWLSAYPWKPLIVFGFLGGLTTFSSFSMDNFILIEQGYVLKALFNIGLNVGLGLAAVSVSYYYFKH